MTTREFLKIGTVPVYFQEDWGTGIGGGLWSTGLALAKYLNSSHASKQVHRLANQKKETGRLNILELGSGNGLLAACWLALAKDKIHNLVITDTKDHLPLIEQTLNANPHLLPSSCPENETETAHCVHVLEHRWGQFQEELPIIGASTAETETNAISHHSTQTMAGRLATGRHCGFDLIVASDVAYHEDLYEPLIESLLRFTEEEKDKTKSCPQPPVILLGCTMSDTTPDFFDRLLDRGFLYQRLADHLLDTEYQGRIFGIFVVQRRRL